MSQTRFINPPALRRPPGYTHVVEVIAPEFPTLPGVLPSQRCHDAAANIHHRIHRRERCKSSAANFLRYRASQWRLSPSRLLRWRRPRLKDKPGRS